MIVWKHTKCSHIERLAVYPMDAAIHYWCMFIAFATYFRFEMWTDSTDYIPWQQWRSWVVCLFGR